MYNSLHAPWSHGVSYMCIAAMQGTFVAKNNVFGLFRQDYHVFVQWNWIHNLGLEARRQANDICTVHRLGMKSKNHLRNAWAWAYPGFWSGRPAEF